MEPLGTILGSGAQQDQRERSAALVVATTTETLLDMLQLKADDLRCLSVRGQEVVVAVTHPVFAAKIQQQHDDLCVAITTTLRRRAPRARAIIKIQTRVTALP